MDYKQNHAYNYGYLSGAVKHSIEQLEAISRRMRGDNKKDIDRTIKYLKSTLNTTTDNLIQTVTDNNSQ